MAYVHLTKKIKFYEPRGGLDETLMRKALTASRVPSIHTLRSFSARFPHKPPSTSEKYRYRWLKSLRNIAVWQRC